MQPTVTNNYGDQTEREVEAFESAKNNLAKQPPLSRDSRIMCKMYANVWDVDFPATANCLGSRLLIIGWEILERVKPSITLANWQVNDTGLISFSIDIGGICLGKGLTSAHLNNSGK